MQNLKNKFGQWIPIVILSVCGLLAAGRISSTQAELCRQVKQKLDKEVYDRDQAHRQREFDRFQKQLDRIEEKLDNVISRHNKDNPGNPGNPKPER